MSTASARETRLQLRLPGELKNLIEQAAAALGQSVGDFAVGSLVQSARSVLEQRDVTELSRRDRDIFVAALDDSTAKPNKALRDAAARYKKICG